MITDKINKTEKFLHKLKDSGHWNDDYDYSKVIYVHSKTKVIVIDERFGSEHRINPRQLIENNTKCSISNAVYKNEYFICQSKEICVDKYDYSLVEWINSKTKVIIIGFQQVGEIENRGKFVYLTGIKI